MPELNVTDATTARVRCYLAGGKDFYTADRVAGAAITEAHPGARAATAACEGFERRALEALADHTQFLVFGAGFDAEADRCIHRTQPDARVLYVDDDELVVVHGRAYSFNTPTVEWTRGGLPIWPDVLETAETQAGFDLTRPVAVVMTRYTEFMPPDQPVGELIHDLFADLAAGSALALVQAVCDFDPARIAELQRTCLLHGVNHTPRSGAEVAQFFTGLRMLDPGIVPPHKWRPAGPFDADADRLVSCLAGVGVKPESAAR